MGLILLVGIGGGYAIGYASAINFCAEQAFKLLSFDNVNISFSEIGKALVSGRLR